MIKSTLMAQANKQKMLFIAVYFTNITL